MATNYRFKAALMPQLIEAARAALGGTWGVFPVIAPQGTTGGVVVVRQEGERVERSKMGIARTVGRFRLYALADSYSDALAAAVELAAALDGELVGGVPCRVADMAQDFTDGRAAVSVAVDMG